MLVSLTNKWVEEAGRPMGQEGRQAKGAGTQLTGELATTLLVRLTNK